MNDFHELIGTYIAESQEFLQSMEESLLAMESSKTSEDRQEKIKDLFRAAHSIKGGALMLGFENLGAAAHAIEDCFAILRDSSNLSELEPATATMLLQAVDLLKNLVEKTSRGEEVAQEEIEEIVPLKSQLEEVYGQEKPAAEWTKQGTVNTNVIKVIFQNDLPPLFDRLESEVSQVEAGNLEETIVKLNEIYYQLSGVAGMLQIPEFARIVEPLRELIDTADLSVEQLRERGWAIAQNLETAREQILEEKPIAVAEEKPAIEASPEEPEEETEVALKEVEVEKVSESEPPAATGAVASANWQRPTIRVDLEHLAELVNLVGELSINRTHLELQQKQLRSETKRIRRSLFELDRFGSQLRDEYDRLSIDGPREIGQLGADGSFDPLEMDRYNEFHTTAQSAIETTQAIANSAGKVDELSIKLERSTDLLRRITERLRSRVIQLRVVPFSKCVDALPRALRELSQTYNKEVNLLLLGRDTKVDESLVDALRDPLVHLVRNAFDHGIESPEARKAAGKPANGQIEIAARHQGGQTIITVTDDGKGIDSEKIRQKAVEKGWLTAEQAPEVSVTELYELLFCSGFSTVGTTTDLSGRGVGLDIVRDNLRKVRGTVKIDSRVGKGTTFIMKLPLMLSIANALLVRTEHTTVAVPLDAVEEILHIRGEDIQLAGSQPMLAWRSEFIRLTRLQELLRYSIPAPEGPSPDPLNQDHIPVLVVASAEGVLAIAVERLMGQQEIVVKPLPSPLSKPRGVVGCTILGDGRVATILDVDDLIAQFHPGSTGAIAVAQNSHLLESLPASSQAPQILAIDDSYTIRQLLSLSLQRARYRVETAKDGQDALEKLEAGMDCDLAIVDIEMPRVDGFEFLRRVKSNSSFARIPVAMLTSRSGAKHRQLAMELGACYYFTKPYNEAQLLEAIANIINN
ncbi:MAG: hybrid sensor histidine kinase/response regulator [Cyanobacteriota bacterium]|nr:hybrid sensor histidine kinase/response regulator [Cyanobacteriota bacterium]